MIDTLSVIIGCIGTISILGISYGLRASGKLSVYNDPRHIDVTEVDNGVSFYKDISSYLDATEDDGND